MQISGNYLRCIVFLLFGIIFYSLPNVLFDLISSINIATDTRLSNSYEYYYQTFTPILGYGFGSFLVLIAYYVWAQAIKLTNLLSEVLEPY